MSMEGDLQSYIASDTTVDGIIDGNIKPVFAPIEIDPPLIIWQLLSKVRERALDGPTDLYQTRIQFTFFESTYAELVTLSNAIRDRIDGNNGTTIGTTEVNRIVLENETDILDINPDLETASSFVRRVDVLVCYHE